jgi:AAA+ superfamily predicted ATPase
MDGTLKIGDNDPIRINIKELETTMSGNSSIHADLRGGFDEIAKAFYGVNSFATYPYTVSIDPALPIKSKQSTPPQLDEERRKNPEEVQYQDLKKGDVIENFPASLTLDVTKITPKRAYYKCREDGREGFWNRDDSELQEYDLRIISDAEREASKISYEDVILPDDSKQAIADALTQIDNHALIFDTWGFGKVLEKGKSISMLFYGLPGTGKTLMAQAIADKYNYKLQVISSAEIESSEPGQAERNLKAFFEAANKDKRTVLLFDECDSLIADRRDVGMILGAQINTLLSSLENYEGIAIFTTNRLEKMDEAFNRRLSLKLEFAMPDAEHRMKIWQRMFPKEAPLEENMPWEKLASIEVAGGYIKNIVLRAARRAANTKEKVITYRIIYKALREEMASMEEFESAVNSMPRIRVR